MLLTRSFQLIVASQGHPEKTEEKCLSTCTHFSRHTVSNDQRTSLLPALTMSYIWYYSYWTIHEVQRICLVMDPILEKYLLDIFGLEKYLLLTSQSFCFIVIKAPCTEDNSRLATSVPSFLSSLHSAPAHLTGTCTGQVMWQTKLLSAS